MKILIVISNAILLFCSCHAQTRDSLTKENSEKVNVSFVNNDSIRHSIILLTCDTCVPISNIGYRVLVQMSKENMKAVKLLSKERWIALLEDKRSDWAANLILYYIYNKDAWLLSRRDSRDLWVKYLKEEDVKFWDQQLLLSK